MKQLTVIIALFFISLGIYAQTATEIVKKSTEKMQGENHYAEMTMKIVRPAWSRSISMKMCSMGEDYSLALITSPAKDKGQAFLMVDNEMWTWNPTIRSIIKIGPSMMSQGWMGSDYSNDELLNKKSIIEDYTHKIIGTETLSGKECHKIECTPKENSAIVWGKQILWISKDNSLQLKAEYYDEDNYLIKTDIASDIKIMDGREIPTRFEIIPEDDPDNKTIIIMNKIIFNITVDKSFFSQQNMKKGMAIRFPMK